MVDKKKRFIDKAIKKHGNKYDYSKVEYTDSLTKVCIICPEHGEFWQTPQAHVRGNGCPKCANIKRGDAFRSNIDEFIERANTIHGGKYIYDRTSYVNAMTKVPILCLEHGTFWMTPMAHLNGQGCPKCKGRGLTNDEVISRFMDKHGKKYDYSLVKYERSDKKVCIICPKHGEFWQTPAKHLIGQGCPKCGAVKRAENKTMTTEEFKEKANKIHGGKYDYKKTIYTGAYNNLVITCPIHGDFVQRANDHLNGHGCQRCGNNMSNAEDEINEFIIGLGFDTITKDKKVLDGKEIDIFVPLKMVGIEYDGLYWHSEAYKDKDYHLKKTNDCEGKGIRLIHIFEDEWRDKKEIIKSMLRNLLGMTEDTVYARKCSIGMVDKEEKKKFLNENHIQGNIASSIDIGLYYNGELVSLMCFGKPRINLGRKTYSEGEYELLRFCNKINTRITGGATKLFKYFLKEYSPITITSYCDRRWSVGGLYGILGFKFHHNSHPNYYYVEGSNRKNRFKYRKSELVKEGYDKDKSEREIMQERGIKRIYDCGCKCYIWKSQINQ